MQRKRKEAVETLLRRRPSSVQYLDANTHWKNLMLLILVVGLSFFPPTKLLRYYYKHFFSSLCVFITSDIDSGCCFSPLAMEFHENLNDLAVKEGLKGRKLHKAVESFTWNITILKVRLSHTPRPVGCFLANGSCCAFTLNRVLTTAARTLLGCALVDFLNNVADYLHSATLYLTTFWTSFNSFCLASILIIWSKVAFLGHFIPCIRSNPELHMLVCFLLTSCLVGPSPASFYQHSHCSKPSQSGSPPDVWPQHLHPSIFKSVWRCLIGFKPELWDSHSFPKTLLCALDWVLDPCFVWW